MAHSLRMFIAAAAFLIFGTFKGTPGIAGETVVELSVPGMTCAACPITVRKSLERVEGVVLAEVSYEELTAMVTYDSSLTDPDALIEATTNVGYPSFVVE